MAKNNLSNSTITDMSNVVNNYEATNSATTRENNYITSYAQWKGYYDEVPMLRALVQRKACWTMGKGYKCDKKTKELLRKIKGNGLDSFNTILFNSLIVATIAGDSYCEIIRNSRNELRNLKPLNPDTIRIIADEKGMIKKYEQTDTTHKKILHTFDKEEIFHIAINRTADTIHGESTIEKIESILKMRKEAMDDLQLVFHRYVKPLWVFSVDEDNQTKIDAFKAKVDNCVNKSENLVVPKDTVDKIERISIPQYSSLDPLPWVQNLTNEFLIAEGVPASVLGSGANSAEATAKVLYLAWQQVVEWNQLFLTEQIYLQLGIEIELEFPASIQPDLKENVSKEQKLDNQKMKLTDKADLDKQPKV